MFHIVSFHPAFSRAGAWLLCLGLACARPAVPPDAPPPYAFDRPATAFELPRALYEISGLTLLDGHHLGAVQDEDGRLYLLDAATGKVVRDEKFAGDGDYEGVERVDRRVFVLRSDGTLFEIEDWQAKDYDAKKHRTGLPKGCDAEGLAHDPARHRLLIACKENPGNDLHGHRAVYAFDLETERLRETPVYTIPLRAVAERLPESNALNRTLRRLLSPLVDLSDFKPSGLAVHPITGRVYVLSSVRRVLAVLEPDGTLHAVWPLPGDRLPQPEGIAFTPEGDLFLASEGRGGKATLLRFTYLPGNDG
ncbi:SdiA-regulated domain-containing protein [Rhodocaloribacter litoris]|uniref:SdiA-regulated domain-containing protein n=1 Tax=Rhodocaloribacter litoris TaxID=2558931 RepID=UPI001422FC8C|nr:SdiA-regulated domain-containing protein [Rhodocaloribacter litoris]QXD14671.1 SdiA-regulated domain-containing protein [Rhodocaloribacter litoris]